MVTIKESPKAKNVARFKYRGPQAQIQLGGVTIMAGNIYETDSLAEIAMLRTRLDDGVVELAPKKEPGPDAEVDA